MTEQIPKRSEVYFGEKGETGARMCAKEYFAYVDRPSCLVFHIRYQPSVCKVQDLEGEIPEFKAGDRFAYNGGTYVIAELTDALITMKSEQSGEEMTCTREFWQEMLTDICTRLEEA